MASFYWPAVASSGTGDVVGPASATDNAIARFDGTTGKLIQNSGATIDDSGNITATNISGTNTGDVTLAAFGSTPNANAASLAGQVLNLQPADGTNPGGVSTTTQTFAGAKTFSTSVTSPMFGTTTANPATVGTVRLASSDTISFRNISNTSNVTLSVNSSGALTTTNFSANIFIVSSGTASSVGTLRLAKANIIGWRNNASNGDLTLSTSQDVNDNIIITSGGLTLTSGSGSTTLIGSGSASFTLPGSVTGSNAVMLSDAIGNLSLGDPFTLSSVGSAPNGSAATFSGLDFSLQPADGTNPGVVTAGTQTIGGAKTFSISVASPLVKMNGATSGVLTHQAAGTTTSYTLTWPSAQGAASTFLKNNGSGTLSWSTIAGSDLPAYTPALSGGTSGIVDGTKGTKGFTDASAVSAGYVGEYFQDTASNDYTASQTGTQQTTRSLGAGTWRIDVIAYIEANATGVGNGYVMVLNAPTTSNTDGVDKIANQNTSVANVGANLGSCTQIINTSGSTTVTTNFTFTRTSGTVGPRTVVTYQRLR